MKLKLKLAHVGALRFILACFCFCFSVAAFAVGKDMPVAVANGPISSVEASFSTRSLDSVISLNNGAGTAYYASNLSATPYIPDPNLPFHLESPPDKRGAFTIQINSNTFLIYVDNNACDGCSGQGWAQFSYAYDGDSGISGSGGRFFAQYWLQTGSCPAGWTDLGGVS
jgi:hypothetical protein